MYATVHRLTRAPRRAKNSPARGRRSAHATSTAAAVLGSQTLRHVFTLSPALACQRRRRCRSAPSMRTMTARSSSSRSRACEDRASDAGVPVSADVSRPSAAPTSGAAPRGCVSDFVDVACRASDASLPRACRRVHVGASSTAAWPEPRGGLGNGCIFSVREATDATLLAYRPLVTPPGIRLHPSGYPTLHTRVVHVFRPLQYCRVRDGGIPTLSSPAPMCASCQRPRTDDALLHRIHSSMPRTASPA